MEKVEWFGEKEALQRIFTCTESGCECERKEDTCDSQSLTVHTEGTPPANLPSRPGCRYGNRVKVSRSKNYNIIEVYEVVIYGVKGEGCGPHDSLQVL